MCNDGTSVQKNASQRGLGVKKSHTEGNRFGSFVGKRRESVSVVQNNFGGKPHPRQVQVRMKAR